MRYSAAFIVGIICVSYSAHSQVRSGTVVVFNVTQDKAVLAADSRATFLHQPPDDTYCKIAAFRNNVIFATSGSASYTGNGTNDQSWSAIDEARSANKSASAISDAKSAANRTVDVWAASMQRIWTALYKRHPELVTDLARRGKGLLTSGVFIVLRNGHFAFATKGIRFSRKPHAHAFIEKAACEMGHFCGLGETDVMLEFVKLTTERARKERDDWLKRPEAQSPIAYVMRLVDLTIKYGPCDVGGKVDALEIARDGKMTWKQKKPNCPECSD